MTWVRARLKDLCVDAGQYGLNISADSYSPSGHRLIRTSDISEDGTLLAEGVHVDIALEPRHVIAPGDLLLSRSGTLGRSMLVPESAAGATFAGYLVRFRPRSDVEPRFLKYVALSAPFLGAIAADAVSSTIQNFNAERYSNIAMMIPPVTEQRRIVDFLDRHVGVLTHVERLIARQIDLTEARETSVLAAASDVPNVPQVSVRRLVDRITSGPRGWGEFVGDAGIPFVRIANIPRRGIRLQTGNLVYAEVPPSAERERTRIKLGDVFVSITADIGSVAIASDEVVGGNVSQHVALLRPAVDRCYPAWLAYMLKAPAVRADLTMSSYGGTKVGLGLQDVADAVIPLPPIAEQVARAREAERELTLATDVTSALNRKKDLIAERRRALITAAVTGQLDVTTARGVG